ncbi:MAG: ABC transporter substrate-binding protein [Syntrophobacteraceae bacterium]
MRKIFLTISCLAFMACSAALSFAKSYEGKKVLFVDSYHEGYEWSDSILRGVQGAFKDTGVDLKVVRMDTKRNGSEEFKKQAGEKVKAEIEAFKPDVVIASDDNASKYVIVPYYKDSPLPFVFCGVNWDASMYGFPCSNVTGMLEVTEVDALIKLLKGLAKGDRLGFIADDSETNRKEVEIYKKVFGIDPVTYYAKTFDDFKKDYTELQGKADYLIFYGWSAISGWNPDEAAEFVLNNTKIPTGTFQVEVMPYAMVGYLKIGEEQGEWAANAALKILDGAKPSDIPIAKNKKGNLILNAKIAEKAGVQLPYDLIQSASKVIE